MGRDENVCALVGGVNNVKVGVSGLGGGGKHYKIVLSSDYS